MHSTLQSVLAICGLLIATGRSLSTQSSDFQSKCETLSNLTAVGDYDVTVLRSEYVAAGSILNLAAEGRNESCAAWDAPVLPASVCRLVLQVPTSNSSSVQMEVWLPEEWSGRFLSTGNGGLAGCIQYPDLAYTTSYGFATVGTDNGHNGQSIGAAYHQPEVLEDFVWRALYTGVVVGKEVTKQFYGPEQPDSMKSYYLGCSTGGRQGFKAIQSYPDLFDGVSVGAPGFDFVGQIAWIGYVFKSLGTTSSDTWLTDTDWQMVHEMVLDQCDNLDGATDGIVEDTRRCHPDPSDWLCDNTTDSDWCLESTQVEAVQKIFTPFVVNGTIIHSGATHGDEARLIQAIYGGLPISWLTEWMSYIVKEDLSWNLARWTEADALESLRQNPFNVQTYDGDISAFRDRGGKVLHWHGQADEYLSITNSGRYYDIVARTLNASTAELDEFYRYFRVSGLGHCWGGPGTNNIGQTFGRAAGDDAENNVLTRIVEWVELGNAPETIRATKFVDDDVTKELLYARKHCKYPKTNMYKGTGNGTDEDGWECVEYES